jgi:hypothetical protein
MTIDSTLFIRRLMDITGVNSHFDHLVESMVQQVRVRLGAPLGGEVAADPQTEAALADLRGRLKAYHVEFERAYQEVLVKYLGEEGVVASTNALTTEPAQRYFTAMKAMEPELVQRIHGLRQQMGATPLQAA